MRTRIGVLLAPLAVALAIPASAQVLGRDIPPGGLAKNDAECHAQFHQADIDDDGFLDRDEVSESRGLMPTTLSNRDEISQQEFLSACSIAGRSGNSG